MHREDPALNLWNAEVIVPAWFVQEAFGIHRVDALSQTDLRLPRESVPQKSGQGHR